MSDQASRLRNLVEERAEEEAQAREIGELDFGMAEDTRVIAITSGKGGVGKTNLAVNLAVGMQMAGQRVMLIDADIGMANVNLLMGSVTNRSLIELLNDDVEIEDVIEDGVAGVKYISGVAGVEAALNLNRAEQRKLHKKLGRCSDIADVIIIDTGAGLNRNVVEFILAAEEVLLITTPEPTALADAYAVIKAYSTYTARRNIKLVVNRIREEEEFEDVATFTRIKMFARRCKGKSRSSSRINMRRRRVAFWKLSTGSCAAGKWIRCRADGAAFWTDCSVIEGLK